PTRRWDLFSSHAAPYNNRRRSLQESLADHAMNRILIATSNPGKLRDFAGAAASYGIEIATVPGFNFLPAVIEDGSTFEANARKKAEHYSRYIPGEMVLGDDSGLEVEVLGGGPGVNLSRYATDYTIMLVITQVADVST